MDNSTKDIQSPSSCIIERGEARLCHAEAKEDYLKLIGQFVHKHEKEFGKSKVLNRAIAAFNEGRIGQRGHEIRSRLRRDSVSRACYYEWLGLYEGRRRPGKRGLAALLDDFRNGGDRIDPKVKTEIESLIWENHQVRFRDIHEHLKLTYSKSIVPSYSAVRRYAKAFQKKNRAELVWKQEGQEGLRDRGLLPAIGKADTNITRPNQRWELDTTVADLMNKRESDTEIITKDGKRRKVIGVIDVYSRSCRYFFVEKEDAFAVGQVIRYMILLWGVPETIVIDNGRPFKNYRILRFLRSLEISVHICIPKNPVEKPHIERSFRGLSDVFRLLTGYTGNSVKNRPKEIHIKYTVEEAQRITDDFVDNIYAERIHGSTGQRPRERMAQPGFVPKKVDPRELDILLMEEHERKVGQGVIKFLGGKYFHASLPTNEKVKFRVNDFDAGELIVFYEGKFLCIAEDFQRRGKTPNEIREAHRAWKTELRTRVKAHDALLNRHRPKDHLIHARIENGKKNKPAELPRKAEILSFPELKNIPFSDPSSSMPEPTHESFSQAEPERTPKIFRTRQEFFLDIRRRQFTGEPLDEVERQFLAEFENSDEYQMIAQLLEDKARSGVSA